MQISKAKNLFKSAIISSLIALSFSPNHSYAAGGNVLLDRGPGLEFAATLSGAYAEALGDPALAARAFERAWTRNKSDDIMFTRMVQSYLIAGDIDNALRVSHIANASLQTPETKMVLAIDALSNGRAEEVSVLLADTNFGAPRALYSRQLQAWALAYDGKKDEAIALASRPSGLRTIDKNANYSRALLYQYFGDFDNADTAYSTAFDAGARASVGIVAYARFLVARGQKDKALEVLKTGAEDADSPQWLYEVRRQIANQTSKERLRRGNKRNINSYISQSLGAVALGLSQEPRAGSPLSELAFAARFDENLYAVKLQSARILYAAKFGEMAERTLSAIPLDNPLGDIANSMRANELYETDKVEAENIALAGANMHPSAYNRFSLAAIYLANDKNAQAEEIYSGLINEFGDKPIEDSGIDAWQLYYGRANALINQRKIDLGLVDLRRALAFEPRNPILLNSVGYTLADNNRNLDEALIFLSEAARQRPRSGETLDSLGWVLFKMGRYQEALERLEVAVTLSPAVAEIAEHLGDVYWRTNRQIEAKLEWGKAAAAYSKEEDKARVNAKITDGLGPETNIQHANAS